MEKDIITAITKKQTVMAEAAAVMAEGEMAQDAKKNCERIPFNRRLSEESINLIKEYAQKNNITETEALEKAIQSLKE